MINDKNEILRKQSERIATYVRVNIDKDQKKDIEIDCDKRHAERQYEDGYLFTYSQCNYRNRKEKVKINEESEEDFTDRHDQRSSMEDA